MATIFAVLALTASGATAQETAAEVNDEATGLPCSPCSIEFEGESHITSTIVGVLVSHCDDDVEGDLYHDGTGHLTWVGTTSQSPGCNVINCIGDGEPLWPISNLGERNPNVVHISTRICLRANGTDFHCDAELNVVGSSFHVQNATMTQLCVNGTRRVEVQWSDTDDGSHDSIEIVHLEG